MITLKSRNKRIIDIDPALIAKILNLYPDENLIQRPFFLRAMETEEISYVKLREECHKLHLPWQLFLLDEMTLEKEIDKIKSRRTIKFTERLIANRGNNGEGISLRIADRLISLQEFARRDIQNNNSYCGLLKDIPPHLRSAAVMKHFNITPQDITGVGKERILERLIVCLERKDIRVSRGVLSNGILPEVKSIRQTYRKSSGFAIKDDKLPYIFLPNEIVDSESHGRQILTLLVLIILIGLDTYNLYIKGDLEPYIQGHKGLQHAYTVATDILLPLDATSDTDLTSVNSHAVFKLSEKWPLTPTAIAITLRNRGVIKSSEELGEIINDIELRTDGFKSSVKRSSSMHNSIKKMCGDATNESIKSAIRSGSISSIQAQYLMFGRVDKTGFEKYRAEII